MATNLQKSNEQGGPQEQGRDAGTATATKLSEEKSPRNGGHSSDALSASSKPCSLAPEANVSGECTEVTSEITELLDTTSATFQASIKDFIDAVTSEDAATEGTDTAKLQDDNNQGDRSSPLSPQEQVGDEFSAFLDDASTTFQASINGIVDAVTPKELATEPSSESQARTAETRNVRFGEDFVEFLGEASTTMQASVKDVVASVTADSSNTRELETTEASSDNAVAKESKSSWGLTSLIRLLPTSEEVSSFFASSIEVCGGGLTHSTPPVAETVPDEGDPSPELTKTPSVQESTPQDDSPAAPVEEISPPESVTRSASKGSVSKPSILGRVKRSFRKNTATKKDAVVEDDASHKSVTSTEKEAASNTVEGAQDKLEETIEKESDVAEPKETETSTEDADSAAGSPKPVLETIESEAIQSKPSLLGRVKRSFNKNGPPIHPSTDVKMSASKDLSEARDDEASETSNTKSVSDEKIEKLMKDLASNVPSQTDEASGDPSSEVDESAKSDEPLLDSANSYSSVSSKKGKSKDAGSVKSIKSLLRTKSRSFSKSKDESEAAPVTSAE